MRYNSQITGDPRPYCYGGGFGDWLEAEEQLTRQSGKIEAMHTASSTHYPAKEFKIFISIVFSSNNFPLGLKNIVFSLEFLQSYFNSKLTAWEGFE